MNLLRPAAAIGWFLLLLPAGRGLAEDFRVETKVYVGEEPEPVSVNVTLFRSPVVYDFLSNPTHIAVYRQSPRGAAGRLILLDPERKERTELATDEVLRFSEGLKEWAAAQNDPLLKFCGQPAFQQELDERQGLLTLTSSVISYRLLTVPAKSRQASDEYREFSDWCTRLGAMLQPGSTPPFPRLEVNRVLAEQQALPREVHLTLPAYKPYRKHDLDVRSEHQVRWRLSKEDLEKIDQADGYLATFRLVDFEKFRHRQ